MELFAILAILVLIQSLFGVGILVFGTPTLLLCGYSYQQTLSILLPCSLCVSILQTTEHWDDIGSFRKEFSLCCLPFVAAGLLLALLTDSAMSLKFAVGILLLFSALCRLSKTLEQWLQLFLSNYKKLFLAAMGCVHGISNMGGGLLTVFANTMYDGKNTIRSNIAFAYGLMAVVQLGVLVITNSFIYVSNTIPLMVLTVLLYRLVGRQLFFQTSHAVYRHSMTALMLSFAILLFTTA